MAPMLAKQVVVTRPRPLRFLLQAAHHGKSATQFFLQAELSTFLLFPPAQII